MFSWESQAEDQQHTLLLQKGVLRAYLRVIPRLLAKQNNIPIDITVTAKLRNDADSSEVFAGEHQLVATLDSSGWVELNVTEGLLALWPPRAENSEIEFTILLRVNCKLSKKVPASFMDLTSISPSQAKRRQRHMSLQPMLLVFIDDEETRKLIRSEAAPVRVDDQSVMIDADFAENSGAEVRKRSTNGACSVTDFNVNFLDIRLMYVVAPHSYNARRCSGSCSHTFLRRSPKLGTNHAKIMASAYLLSTTGSLFPQPPKEPCCVPEKYSSLTMIIRQPRGVDIKMYPSMTVESCECR